MNSLFVNLQKIINSILSKYLRFIVKKNICQYIYLWLNLYIYRSFDECLKPHEIAVFFCVGGELNFFRRQGTYWRWH